CSLAFHRSTRAPGFLPSGGSATPAVAPRRSPTMIALNRGSCGDPTDFVDVLEARRSWRAWPAKPMTFDAFSRLFWLSARNRSVVAPGELDERVSRPYPSGGGAYSLELYPVIAPQAVES